MELFVARVELHGVSHDEAKYVRLHELMLAVGFYRTILGDDGITYHMLTAEYFMQSNKSLDEVLNLAKTAANSIATKNGVFISQLKLAKWDGLIPS